MSICLIVDVTDLDDYPDHFGGGHCLPLRWRPTVVQAGRATADREALRLAKAHPDRRFFVFEAVAAGLTIKVPTHVSISGRVLVEGSTAALVQIGESTPIHNMDRDIPF